MTKYTFLKLILILLITLVTTISGYAGWRIWQYDAKTEKRSDRNFNNYEVRTETIQTVGDYYHLLPRSFRQVKFEFVDFERDGVPEIVVLGQDHTDIKIGGTGDEIPADEIFIFSKNPETKRLEEVFSTKVDTQSDDPRRNKIIQHLSFRKISLLNREGIAYLVDTPSASSPCKDSVNIIYRQDTNFKIESLGDPSFPICLQLFRQKNNESLELIYAIFRATPEGTFIDAHCCPTGGTVIHEYRIQNSKFHKTHVEYSDKNLWKNLQ